jgi:hypothetical protein
MTRCAETSLGPVVPDTWPIEGFVTQLTVSCVGEFGTRLRRRL